MQVVPITADVQRQVEANSGLMSAMRRGPDFSRYLSDPAAPPPIPVKADSPDDQPEMDDMAREIYGSAFDPVNRVIELDRWAQNTQAETDAFARKLGGLLRGAGIDTHGDIRLRVGADGSILVSGDRPDKQQIEAYFFVNPELANEYRHISSNNDLVAQAKLSNEYSYRWRTAKNDSERQQVFSYFSSLFDQVGSLSSQMTLSRDSLVSAALAYAAQVLKS